MFTAKIFKKKDADGSGYLVDKVLDKAGQKGTGKWTSQVALDLGIPIPTMNAAVEARILSSFKDERVNASKVFSGPKDTKYRGDKQALIDAVHDAVRNYFYDFLYKNSIMSPRDGGLLLSPAVTVK